MVLTEGECQKLRSELEELKLEYAVAGPIPDVAKGRICQLETALSENEALSNRLRYLSHLGVPWSSWG